MYQFLGDVNVFHGRVSHGRVGNAEDHFTSSEVENLSDEHEVTFVRPHDLELSPSRTMPEQLEAVVQFINAAGARVHLELESKESPGLIVVELTKERYRELKIQQGDVVFIHPKQLHVFKVPSSG